MSEANTTEALLTANQVAERLNMHVYTVRELLRSGDLMGYKIRNRRWRVKASDVEKFLKKYSRR